MFWRYGFINIPIIFYISNVSLYIIHLPCHEIMSYVYVYFIIFICYLVCASLIIYKRHTNKNDIKIAITYVCNQHKDVRPNSITHLWSQHKDVQQNLFNLNVRSAYILTPINYKKCKLRNRTIHYSVLLFFLILKSMRN